MIWQAVLIASLTVAVFVSGWVVGRYGHRDVPSDNEMALKLQAAGLAACNQMEIKR